MARFARYDLLQKISGSGVSESWTAIAFHKDGSSVDVVLKRILPEAVDPAMQEKLLEDVEAAMALEHANAARIHDCGWLDDGCFLATERVRGVDAKTLLQRGASVPPRVALHIATGVLQALHHAHRRMTPVIHRDVTPSNVLLSLGGHVKLTGFGLGATRARLGRTREGARYASPEQTRGEKLDGRSDLYSAGLVLHELLTGKPVFPPEAAADAPIPWPSSVSLGSPPEIDALAVSLCEPELAKRFATGLDAVEAIARWGRERGLVLREDGPRVAGAPSDGLRAFDGASAGLAELVAQYTPELPPPRVTWRLVQSGEAKGRSLFSTDATFRPEPVRDVDPRRIAERITRESTDPTVSAMKDLDLAAGEEHTRPQWDSIRELSPDPGEITREGTRERFLEPSIVGAVEGSADRAFDERPTVTQVSGEAVSFDRPVDPPTLTRASVPVVKPPARSANYAIVLVALLAVFGVMGVSSLVCAGSYLFFVY